MNGAVKLSTADGLPLWTSGELTATTVEWPGSVPASAGTYLWQVVALRDGREVAESVLVRLDLE